MPMNYARTALLLALLTAIFVALGAAVGGKDGARLRILHCSRHERRQPLEV